MGLNTELDIGSCPVQALSDVENMYYVSPYMMRTRGGMPAQYTTSGGDVKVMYYWSRDSKLYHGDDAAHLYKNGTAVSGTSGDVYSMVSYGNSSSPTLIVAEDKGARTHTLHTYNGSSYATLTGTSVPTAEKVFSHLGRLFATCDTAYPDRVYWCAAGDHTNYAGLYGEGSYLDVYPGQWGVIKDALVFKGVVYVWKERAVCRIVGDDTEMLITEQLYEIDKPLAGTMVDCQRGVIYATETGVFPLGDISGESADLTRNVEVAILEDLTSGKAAYSAELSGYVLVNGTTTIWVSNHHNRPDVWTKFTAPVAMSAVYSGNGLWFGSTAGDVYLYDNDAVLDDTTPVSASFKTGFWDFGTKRRRKEISCIEGPMNVRNSANMTLRLYTDGASVPAHTRTLAADDIPRVGPLAVQCWSLAVELTYAAMTGRGSFAGMNAWVEDKGEIQ